MGIMCPRGSNEFIDTALAEDMTTRLGKRSPRGVGETLVASWTYPVFLALGLGVCRLFFSKFDGYQGVKGVIVGIILGRGRTGRLGLDLFLYLV